MAHLPNTISFGKVVVTIDDPTNPGNQIAPCGFLKKSLKLSSATSDTVVPDCDNPDAPAFIQRNIVSLSAEISGSGAMAGENTAQWMQFWMGGQSRQCVITYNVPGAQGGFTLSGLFLLSDWSLDADRKSEGGRTQQSVTLQSDGLLTYAPLP